MPSFLVFLLLFLPSVLISNAYTVLELKKSTKLLNFTDGSMGPESIAFDSHGGGPYTGVSDGRVLKWQQDQHQWLDFAVASPQWSGEVCNGSHNPRLENVCGRPLGLQFCSETDELYIADAYFGLLAVGDGGRSVAQLATSANGQPFRFTNGMDIDRVTGIVYFTDSSTLFQRRNNEMVILSRDRTGRLMKYDPNSKCLTVLHEGLMFPNGVAISEDNTFLLLSETSNCRILRYWVKGSRAGIVEVFAELGGFPDNIKRTAGGDFWVALNNEDRRLARSIISAITKKNPILASIWKWKVDEAYVLAVKLSEDGTILQVLVDRDGTVMTSTSEVNEFNGSLWIGSMQKSFVAVHNL